ncbi:MAG: tetratricopeptide repeat protein, partial [Bacteroidia bacterium]|nr:tetratricopeptide repeat protein [Bacteroidia bacterium]
MNRYFFFVLVILLVGCQNSDVNIPATDTTKNASIAYPLPRSNDSLFLLLSKCNEDSNTVNILNEIAIRYFNINLDSAIHFDKQAILIAEKIKWKKGMAASYGDLGVMYFWKSDYANALEYYQKAVKLDRENNASKQLAVHLGNIGTVYESLSDYPKALDYDLQSLKISESINGKYGMQRQYANIGIIYKRQGDFVKALDYYNRALKIAESLNDKTAIAVDLGNIATTCFAKKDYASALTYHLRSLKIDEEESNKNGIARNLGNIGNVYAALGSETRSKKKTADSLFKLALDYYERSLKGRIEIDNRNDVAIQLGSIGNLNIMMGDYTKAFHSIYRSLILSDSLGARENVKDSYWLLNKLYEQTTIPLPDTLGGKMLTMEQVRLRSTHYFKRFVTIRDTLFSSENKKQFVRKEMTYEFDKKEAVTKAENDKKEALAKEQLHEKEKERNYFIAGFVLVLLLAGFIFR